MKKNNNGKILIVGAGRSGTTFLVHLLTELGFNTGYYRGSDVETKVDKDIRAGLEYQIDIEGTPAEVRKQLKKNLPYIVKAPYASLYLKPIIELKLIDVEHVILPIRDIEEATQSRVDAGLYYDGSKPEYSIQKQVGLMAIGTAIEAVVVNEVPYTTMQFPRLVKDEEYCYTLLKQIFGKQFPTRKQFKEVFKRVSKPRSIKTKIKKVTARNYNHIKIGSI